jgi:hypothetical protein
MRKNRKKLSFLATFCILLLTLGTVFGNNGNFVNMSGDGHTGCHTDQGAKSVAGTLNYALSSGSTVSPSESFTATLWITGMTVAAGNDISVGFVTNGGSHSQDTALFSYDVTHYYRIITLDGSGNSGNVYFQITAPTSVGSYTIVADAIEDPDGGGAEYLDYLTVAIPITVAPANNPPQFSNLIESADPLELGQEETFKVDVTDSETSVNAVLIELENLNYTMSNTFSNTYEYNWTPSTSGLKNYIIYANDTEGSWNSISGSINVIDTTIPLLSSLVESADPLELGQTETIQINATDLSGISQVLIEINNVNYTMTNILGAIWEYNTWTPTSTGIKLYIIYANDTEGNWASLSDSITVQDTVQPSLTDLVEITDPLELGQTETIQINATDLSGISKVMIEIASVNHTMNNVGGSTWEYNNWTPTTTGLKLYTIYANDSKGNWNSLTNSIIVQDTTIPLLSSLVESADPLELGQTETIQINATDLSSISQVLIEINNVNYTMTNIGGSTWEYRI